jgi:cell division protein FtsB
MNTLIGRIAVGVFSLLSVAILLLAVFDDGGMLAVNERHEELRRLDEQIQQLREENASLETQIDALKNDPAAMEKIAREQIGLVKPGEVILVKPKAPAKK